MRRCAAAAAVAVLAFTGASCSSDDNSGDDNSVATTAAPTSSFPPIAVGAAPVLVEQIRPAIAALEQELGGPQQYFEVNATPTLVNLFLATENATKAVAYVFQGGALRPPAEAQTASGPIFTAADLSFDETLVLAQVIGELPTSNVVLFAVNGVEGGGATYRAAVQSSLGGSFEVTVGPTGTILGTMGGIDPTDTIPASLPESVPASTSAAGS